MLFSCPYRSAISVLVFSVVSLALPIQPSFSEGLSDGKRPEKNILFFITDDESPTLGCYSDHVARTPNIDELARDGTRFVNAYATTASCSASRSVVLSGLHNHKNGQYGHQHHFHKFASFQNVVSLALPRVLAVNGYRTARCGKYHVAPETVYHFETSIKSAGRNVVQMADNCREFLENQSDDRPFFLYFATQDPHRGGGVDQTSSSELKPNLFGNRGGRKAYPGVEEVFYDPQDVVVPKFLPDTPETREELAQYYQSCSRIDQGLGRLLEILKANGLYDKTLIVFTSDHGMAFSGGKTTVYEPGLKVPFVVRNPYEARRNVVSAALISHVDITPSLVDFAGGLDGTSNGPKNWLDPNKFWKQRGEAVEENRDGGHPFRSYQGKSWISILGNASASHHETLFASHTFHEIQMYYPMHVLLDRQYKLIWNIAYKLDYPFASDLWVASTWQAQYQQGISSDYGVRSVERSASHHETLFASHTFHEIQKKTQSELEDPWVMKWEYE